MTKPSICCVVPTIRESQMESFRKAWAPLFEKHGVTLITVWDGDEPKITVNDRSSGDKQVNDPVKWMLNPEHNGLICRRTDAVRNMGFIFVAETCWNEADYIFTADDDVHPPAGSDPIQEHLDVLQRRVPISWMNTAQEFPNTGTPGFSLDGAVNNKYAYLRGFPYGIRDEAQVMVSHGVWVNVPDFDGKTQLELGKCQRCDGTGGCKVAGGVAMDCDEVECVKCNGTGYDRSKLPYSLPYFRGPVPKGCYFPFCGMNVMIRKEALPYLYFAPMGMDSGYKPKWIDDATDPAGAMAEVMGDGDAGLNRFADIWCGILLKRHCDAVGWAIYTGASTVIHTRASDPHKNVEQEKLGMEWNEWAWQSQHKDVSGDKAFVEYWRSYLDKANRFRQLIQGLQSK